MKLIEYVPIGALAGISFAGSFTHISDLAARSGQDGWMAYAIAVSVDLLAVVASLEIRRDKRLGRRSIVPVLVLALAVLTTLAANLAEAQRTPWGYIVAGVPAGCFLLAVALIERRGGDGLNNPSTMEEEKEVSEPYTPDVPAGQAHGTHDLSAMPEPKPVRRAPRKGPRNVGTPAPADLLVRAREIDQAHRQEHGRRISRDALRAALGVSTGTASQVLRELKTA